MKSLTPTQFDTARAKAAQAVEKHIGDKPTRSHFKREYGSLFDILDIIALLIFVAALVVSSTHIIALMGEQAAATYKNTITGVQVSEHAYTVVHQLGLIFMAELSAILFLVMFNMSKNYIFLGMAILAALFVFGANIASGLHVFIALMPPVFTLGIGYRLETIIVEYLRRRKDLDTRYTEALSVYEAAIADPKTHPAYIASLRAEVWRGLASKNKFDGDTPPEHKLRAVAVEISRHDWTSKATQADLSHAVDGASMNGHTVHLNGNGEHLEDNPLALPTTYQSGQ